MQRTVFRVPGAEISYRDACVSFAIEIALCAASLAFRWGRLERPEGQFSTRVFRLDHVPDEAARREAVQSGAENTLR